MNKKTYLVDEPAWAQDFAPNGRQNITLYNTIKSSSLTIFLGILVKEGEILTRKRYAKYVYIA